MAISRGKESRETQEFKRYIGVAPVFIKAINPTKEEQEDLFGVKLDEAPVYIGKVADNNGNEYANARISIILQPDSEKIGFEMPLISMALFLQKRYRYNNDNTKVQVIDKYGRTAWGTVELAKANKPLMDKNGVPLNIDHKSYRPAYVGEEELMNFVKTYLCIPNVSKWDANSRSWVPNTDINPEDCECRFDDLSKVFSGDFTEIKSALGFQPTNKVKVLLGVRTDTKSGKLYQAVYTKRFLSNAASKYDSLDREIQDSINNAIANGRAITTEYRVVPVQEYTIEATTFSQDTSAVVPSSEMPFEEGSISGSPWE